MYLSMTKIYKFQDDISLEALKELEQHSCLAIDTEGSLDCKYHIEIN